MPQDQQESLGKEGYAFSIILSRITEFSSIHLRSLLVTLSAFSVQIAHF